MAAHLPESQAQFEYMKMQLIGSLGAVAETMRNCATFADQFAQLIQPIGYPGAPMLLPNGQMAPMPPLHPMEPTGGKRKAPGDEEVEGKRKRKTKPKDPNAPKRPPSSYLLFQNEVRQELKAKHPGVSNNELLAMISQAWSDMPKEQKDTYEVRQRLAKDNYLSQKAEYESKANVTAMPAPLEIPQPLPVMPVVAATSEGGESSEATSDDDSDKASNASDGADEHPSPKKPKLEPKSEDVKVKKQRKNKE